MPELSLLMIFIGFLLGAISALTGTGGSIFAIPLLMLGFNMTLNQAAPIALLAVVSASSIAVIQGLRAGMVRYKTALLMAAFGIAFAPLGVWLAKQIPAQILNLFFAVILVYVAFQMWQQSTKTLLADENKLTPPCIINPATSKLFWTALCTRRLIFTGSIAGMLSGLLGVGGGFVIVPSLLKVSNFNMQTIIATSLAVVALVSTTTVLTHAFNGDIQWKIALPFMIGTMLGMASFRLISFKIT
ncbi:MAG: sulfite exporter TauE/SafE family protein [Methylophilaceae bacterium]